MIVAITKIQTMQSKFHIKQQSKNGNTMGGLRKAWKMTIYVNNFK